VGGRMGLTCCRWCLATICYCSLLLSGMSCAAIAIQLLVLLRVRLSHLVNINYNPLHLQSRDEPVAPSVQWHSPIRQQSRHRPRHQTRRARRVTTDPRHYNDPTRTLPLLPQSPAPSTRQAILLAKTPRTRLPSHTDPVTPSSTHATTRPPRERQDSLPSRVPLWPSSS
jgi:hypothetical protein